MNSCMIHVYNVLSVHFTLCFFSPPVPPSEVELRTGEVVVKDGGIMTVTEDMEESVTCVTRNSNPAPLITWMLGEYIVVIMISEEYLVT